MHTRSRRAVRRLILAVAILLALTAVGKINAQDFRAKLTVSVTDPAGLMVPGASLELRSSSTATFNTNISDPNFGTVFPANSPSLDVPPRVIQLGLKASW